MCYRASHCSVEETELLGFRRMDYAACGKRARAQRAIEIRRAVRLHGPSYFMEFMEAPGIEPGSENRSTTATTCVVRCLMSPSAGQQTSHRRMSPLDLARPPRALGRTIPDLRY